MNPNTRLRLWKESRALLPMWAAVAAAMIAPKLLMDRNPLNLSIPAYWFACALLGAAAFSSEFQHRTVAMLLAQPIPRRRVWWEKHAILGLGLTGLLLLMLGLWFTDSQTIIDRDHESWRWILLLEITPFFYAAFIGFTTGPALALLTRSLLGGATLAIACPWALFLVCLLIFPAGHVFYRSSVFAVSNVTFVGSIYCGLLFLVGCRCFGRLEDVNLLAQEFAAPRQFDSLFARLTSGLAPERGSMMANLVRKELRLQRPAFFVATFVGALWLAFIGLWRVRPEVEAVILFVPTILLCFGIPIIVGITSTAEERSLGVHGWHLTLPVSVRRQWGVKLAVALAVNAGLGIALPSLLGHMTVWLADLPHLTRELNGNFNVFATVNLIILLAACFASTFSPNVLRALIGTIVVLVAVGLFSAYVLPPIERHQYRFWAWARAWGQASASVIAPERLWPMVQWYGYARMAALGSGVLLLGWLVWRAAIGNFRGATIPWWIPARQLGCLALATYCYWFLRGFEPHFLGGLFETIRVGH